MKSNKQPTTPKVYNFIDQNELYEMIDEQVKNWLNNPSNHFKIEKAINEKYLGHLEYRDYKGLIGYLRMNFGKQIKILNELDNYLPIYDAKFVEYFRGSWFADIVLKSNYGWQQENTNKINTNMNYSLVLEEHFELLKN
jgi:hypothetical protein